MRKLRNEELNRMDLEAMQRSVKYPFAMVLDSVRSMHNVGAVFRTADAFRIEKICLCGITATPPHREIHKTALGATESVTWHYYKTISEALEELGEANWKLVAIEQADESIKLQNFRPGLGEKIAFIFGNEIHGVSDAAIEKADEVVEIPQYGTKHSVNLSVSAGIVLWHAFFHLDLFE